MSKNIHVSRLQLVLRPHISQDRDITDIQYVILGNVTLWTLLRSVTKPHDQKSGFSGGQHVVAIVDALICTNDR
jgi:hypothetical protein